MKRYRGVARQIIHEVVKRKYPRDPIEQGEIDSVARLIHKASGEDMEKIRMIFSWMECQIRGVVKTRAVNRKINYTSSGEVLQRVKKDLSDFHEGKSISFVFKIPYEVDRYGRVSINFWFLTEMGVPGVDRVSVLMKLNNQQPPHQGTWDIKTCVGEGCSYVNKKMAGKTIELEFEALIPGDLK